MCSTLLFFREKIFTFRSLGNIYNQSVSAPKDCWRRWTYVLCISQGGPDAGPDRHKHSRETWRGRNQSEEHEGSTTFAEQTRSWQPNALIWAFSATQLWLMPQLPNGLSGHSTELWSILTPANDDEDPQVVLVGEESHEDQAVQVETFHQNPVVVGGQKIEEEGHCHLATNLWAHRQKRLCQAGP